MIHCPDFKKKTTLIIIINNSYNTLGFRNAYNTLEFRNSNEINYIIKFVNRLNNKLLRRNFKKKKFPFINVNKLEIHKKMSTL